MPTTTKSKIQVRRGPLSDLPILDEGEFGYALDYHRLFIGNTPLVFTGNGHTKRYTVQDRTILPNQIAVLVDNSEVNIGVEYSLEETDIVFAYAPHAAEEIFYKIGPVAPLSFIGDGVTSSISYPSNLDPTGLKVFSYKNHDPINYIPLDIAKVFSSNDPVRPNQLEVSGTFGFEIDQMFVVLTNEFAAAGLLVGHNYYVQEIVDPNHIKLSTIRQPAQSPDPNEPAVWPVVQFSQTLIGLARARFGGELLQVDNDYTYDGSTIVFAAPPEGPANIKISFNTELQIQGTISDHFRLPLNPYITVFNDTGLSVNILEANTMLIDYSVKTANNKLRVGTIQLITDGTTGNLKDTASDSVDDDGICFGFRIESNRLYLTYMNMSAHSANFYYSIKLWNTI